MSVLSSVGMFSSRRLKPTIFHYFHFSVLMGKRKEESISKPGSHKRQRQEYTDEHSDDSNEEENSQSSADSNFSFLSVSLKSWGGDVRKS